MPVAVKINDFALFDKYWPNIVPSTTLCDEIPAKGKIIAAQYDKRIFSLGLIPNERSNLIYGEIH